MVARAVSAAVRWDFCPKTGNRYSLLVCGAELTPWAQHVLQNAPFWVLGGCGTDGAVIRYNGVEAKDVTTWMARQPGISWLCAYPAASQIAADAIRYELSRAVDDGDGQLVPRSMFTPRMRLHGATRRQAVLVGCP